VLEKIVAVWEPVYERSDVVIVEGLSPGPAWLYASELNQALARALDADVVVVGRWPAAEAGRPDRAGQGAGTGPGLPPRTVEELTQAASATGLSILAAEDNSYETATRVRAVDPGLPVDDLERIDGVVNSIADALDAPWLESLPGSARSRRLSPAAFRYRVVERARAAGACVVLPEGTEPRTMQAAVACAERGIARSVLLGPPDQIARLARESRSG